MEDSILNSVKKRIGYSSDYDAFDEDIIQAINSAFSTLTQIGAGPTSGYRITGTTETWSDYLNGIGYIDCVKDYVYLKVRHVFDPPASSSVMQSIENQIKELEWRINVAVETAIEEGEDEEE